MSSSSLVCLTLLLVSFTISEARDFLVGGDDRAWRVPRTTTDSLNRWAERNRFHIGDSLGNLRSSYLLPSVSTGEGGTVADAAPACSLEVRRREGLGAAGDQGGVLELQQVEPGSGAQGWGDRSGAAPLGGVLLHQRRGGGLPAGGEADRGGDVGAALASRRFRSGSWSGGVRGPGGGASQRSFDDGGTEERSRRCSAGVGGHTVMVW
ncbi:hypothetical protein B296_00043242 [Ensete ventricosum]|uniref:Phytocyanin domain-containing protein n=1 Tax=Ensete ventricosum TaxID=4639 RepID=A0A426XNP3_ENSVE|nr:hypothetical protein B296_00043242 [Ensete ventricosum]